MSTEPSAGGSAADYIAKWNGSTWSALGSGLYGGVSALAVSGSDLYVGGGFTSAGGSAANCIAKWDGSAWSALGSGVSGGKYGTSVDALALSGTNLYIGGNFTIAGGRAANYVAKWDGSAWSALGSGVSGSSVPQINPSVRTLAVSGSDLYVGGWFTTAGGSTANNIAKWDGSAWSALDSGMNSFVKTLAVSGGDLYVGGDFTTAGGSTANNIAKWNGSTWSALGSGLSRGMWGFGVYAMAISGNDLYVSGAFASAGGKFSPYLAAVKLPPNNLDLLLPSRGGWRAILGH